jgi:hypothetical protein
VGNVLVKSVAACLSERVSSSHPVQHTGMVQSRAGVWVERNTTYLNPAGRSERWSTFEGNRPNQYTVKPEVGSVMVTSPEGFLWYSSARIDRHQQYVLVSTLTTTTYEESSKPVNRHVKRVVSKPLLATRKDAQRLTLLSSAISEVVQLLLRSTSYVRSL